MPEKSIILHAHEIRRLLDVGEAQIWRPVRPQPVQQFQEGWPMAFIPLADGSFGWCRDGEVRGPFYRCPHGQPGERRWVRETWAWTPAGDYCTIPLQPQDDLVYYKASAHSPDSSGWRSPVSMPREFSRLTVEILDVKARQVWSITEEEAREAGIRLQGCLARDKFARDWTRRYAKHGLSWEKNPGAWVIKLARREASTHA